MTTRPVLPTPQEEARRFLRPFFVLVAVSLLITYTYTVLGVPEMREPARLVVFTGLIGLSAVLHWLFTWQHIPERALLPYLIAQGLLMFVLTIVGRSIGVGIGLSMMLTGEALGALGINWRGLLAMSLYLLLAGLGFTTFLSPPQITAWAMPFIPAAVFVVLFAWMFRRQAEARESAQALVRDLDAANRQLTEYAAQVEDLTLVAERQRMARELHDTLSQGLAGLILQLEAVDSHLARGHVDKAQSIVQQAMDRARITLADARRAIDDLRALRASDQSPIDLASAIRVEADHFSAATGLPCDLDMQVPPDLSTEIVDNVQRMISEGLANVARHATATHVHLQLRSTDHALVLLIRDDGCGFDPGVIGQSGHYGLIGLQERARAFGGTLTIDSAPGRGTTLKIELPAVVKD